MRPGAPDFRIVVPGAPRGVKAPAIRVVKTKTGRTFATSYTHASTRTEMGTIRQFAFDEMRGRAPWDCPLELRWVAYVPIPKSMPKRQRVEALEGTMLPVTKPDFDNMVAFIDALNKIVFVDDSRIVDAHIYKRYSETPRIVVELRFMRDCDRPAKLAAVA